MITILQTKIKEELFISTVTEQQDLLFRLAYGILHNASDAEDAVSEAVAKAWENHGSLKRRDSMQSWLIGITLNVSKNMLKKVNINGRCGGVSGII